MVKERIVRIPAKVNVDTVIEFSKSFEIPECQRCVFDFTNVSWCEPFGLLYLARILRSRSLIDDDIEFVARTRESSFRGYASHIGFFRYAGFKRGNRPGEVDAAGNYVPIQRWRISDVQEEAGYSPYGELIERKSIELCRVMLQTDRGNSFDYIQYALREILRNSVEHSSGEEVIFCAQYWPTKKSVEIAIIDDGVGLKRALRSNDRLSVPNDAAAVQMALMPGISGKAKNKRRRDVWENSGYGLFMTSNLCGRSGSFRIVSGKAGIHLSEGRRTKFNARFKGTGVQLRMEIPDAKALNDMLQEFRLKGRQLAQKLNGKSVIEPSMASLMLANDFKKRVSK